jgi:hypothetical protein
MIEQTPHLIPSLYAGFSVAEKNGIKKKGGGETAT